MGASFGIHRRFRKDLFSNSNREHFDPLFQNIVETKVGDILRDLSSCSGRDSVIFSFADIKTFSTSCKQKGHAEGMEYITRSVVAIP